MPTETTRGLCSNEFATVGTAFNLAEHQPRCGLRYIYSNLAQAARQLREAIHRPDSISGSGELLSFAVLQSGKGPEVSLFRRIDAFEYRSQGQL